MVKRRAAQLTISDYVITISINSMPFQLNWQTHDPVCTKPMLKASIKYIDVTQSDLQMIKLNTKRRFSLDTAHISMYILD